MNAFARVLQVDFGRRFHGSLGRFSNEKARQFHRNFTSAAPENAEMHGEDDFGLTAIRGEYGVAVDRLETGGDLRTVILNANVSDPDRVAVFFQENALLERSPVASVAARMIQAGILTPFQVKQLLAGKRRGFVLSGKFRVLDVLGVGGMGQVLLCEHLRMRSLVALKVLPPDRLENPTSLERFYREARASAALRDEHLVRAYDLDSDGEFHYLVMEYVYGVSLQQLVQQRGPLELNRALDYIRQAAIGLSRIHAAGLVHRDIKPGNIMVDRKGTVILLDLGLARFRLDQADDLTDRLEEGVVLGTADYIAPEQVDASSKADGKADLYSLGFTLYFLLAGKPPFATGTVSQKVLWHKTRHVDLREARLGIPEELARIFERMTAKNPQDRFETPEQLAEALDSLPVSPVPPPTPDELPELCPAVQRLLGREYSTEPITVPRTSSTVRRGLNRPSLDPTVPPPRRFRWRLLLIFLSMVSLSMIVTAFFVSWDLLIMPSALPASPYPGSYPDPMTGIDENPEKAIAAELAVSRIGQRRTVLMQVKGRKKLDTGILLLSTTDPTSPRNFTVMIPQEELSAFTDPPIMDPYEYYWGMTIQVTGHVVLLDGMKMPGIRVTLPAQIVPFRPPESQ